MKRVFFVELESVRLVPGRIGMQTLRLEYESIADTAVGAIRRAFHQARRDHRYRGAYIVANLKHRGPAV
jgi:hypothetical protein